MKKLKNPYFCECEKAFLTNSGLWKHNKNSICANKNVTNNSNTITNYENILANL